MSKKLREEFVLYKNPDNEYFLSQNKEKSLQEVKFAVKKPNHLQQQTANFEYSKYVNKCLKDGIMPLIKAEETIRANGIWNDEKEKEENKLRAKLQEGRNKLAKGKMKLSEGEKLAKENIKTYSEILYLTMQKNNILDQSAERLAENHKFNWLVSQCTVYSDVDKVVFSDYEDFLKKDNLEETRNLTWKAGQVFSHLIYNMDTDYREDLPEYKFLKKYNFVNDKLQYVNKENKLVDDTGKVVEEPETILPDAPEAEFFPDDQPETKIEEKTVEVPPETFLGNTIIAVA